MRRYREARQGLRPERREKAEARAEKQKVRSLAHYYRVAKPKNQERRERKKAKEAEEAERRILPYLPLVTAEDREKERVLTVRALNTRGWRDAQKTKTSEGSDKENEDPEVEVDEMDYEL